MTKAERARELFLEGYNCSQSIAGAFCDELGLDFERAVTLSAGFGGGMGRLREVCGSFSGITLVLSAVCGYKETDDTKKKALYEKVQTLGKEFKKRNGSLVCRDILSLQANEKTDPTPEKRTEQYYASRPCATVVYNAAAVLEEFLSSQAE